MALFPNYNPQFMEPGDRELLTKMSEAYADDISILQTYWTEGDTDARFFVGDATLYNELYGNLPVNRRKQFNFNRIRRVVNMISGRQRQTRKSIVATPVENADSQTADQFTKVLMWSNNQEGILETFSDACEGSLVTGLNLLQVWLDFRSDPVSGTIKVDRCAYNSFLIDPFFRKADLSDCNHIWKRSFLTKKEILSLLPDKADQVMELFGRDNRDGKFQFMPENYNMDMKNLITYDEFYYKSYRNQRMLIDSQTGETLEWKFTNKEENLREFLRLYPQVTIFDQEVPTVKMAIVVNGKVMFHGPNPLGIDSYPFVAVMGYYCPELPYFPWRIQGVVRGLRDAQYLYNRRKAIELDILESQINSGFIYKENALVNPKDIFLSGQGKGLALKEEAQMTDVVPIPSPAIHPSVFQVSEGLAKELNEITGLSEENLASASDDIAGVLSMLRQGAGLIGLQGLFDGWDRALKLLGRIELDVIQANFAPGKVKKILEEEPTAQFYSKAFGKYDVTVEEGLNTTTQKQMQLAQILQLREAGVPIPDDVLLDAATIQDKRKVIESVVKAQESQRQMQEQQAQLAMYKLQAEAKLAEARAAADQGLAVERASKVADNESLAFERRARSVQEENAAMLNLVKALKEIDTLDLTHLEQLLVMQQTIKQQESNVQQEVQTGQINKPVSMKRKPLGTLGKL